MKIPKLLLTFALLAITSFAFAERTGLGVVTVPVHSSLADHLGIPKGFGIQVQQVMPNSPAAAAGLKVGDLLLELDDQRLISPNHLVLLVREKAVGDSVAISYLHKGTTQSVNTKLAQIEKLEDCGCKDCGCKDCGCKDCGCKDCGCKDCGCKDCGCKDCGCKDCGGKCCGSEECKAGECKACSKGGCCGSKECKAGACASGDCLANQRVKQDGTLEFDSSEDEIILNVKPEVIIGPAPQRQVETPEAE